MLAYVKKNSYVACFKTVYVYKWVCTRQLFIQYTHILQIYVSINIISYTDVRFCKKYQLVF